MNSCKKTEDDARWEGAETDKYSEASSVIELQRSVARALFGFGPSGHHSWPPTHPPSHPNCVFKRGALHFISANFDYYSLDKTHGL